MSKCAACHNDAATVFSPIRCWCGKAHSVCGDCYSLLVADMSKTGSSWSEPQFTRCPEKLTAEDLRDMKVAYELMRSQG